MEVEVRFFWSLVALVVSSLVAAPVNAGWCNLEFCVAFDCAHADAGNCRGACTCSGGVSLAGKAWSKCQCYEHVGGDPVGDPDCDGDIVCFTPFSVPYGLDAEYQLVASPPTGGELVFASVAAHAMNGMGWRVVVDSSVLGNMVPGPIELDGTFRSVLEQLAAEAATSISFDVSSNTIYVPSR